MNLENLIESSSPGVARFLRHAKELGYGPSVVENNSQIRDAWTMAYGVGEETYMLIYSVDIGAKKYPTRSVVRKVSGLKGNFDRKQLLEQGLANLPSEMNSGEITPFLSQDFDKNMLHITIDQASIEQNELVKFPAGIDDKYFAITLNAVFQTLQSLYGKERVIWCYLSS